MTAPQPLATPEQVAAWLQKDPAYLAKLRKTGRGPHFIKIGRDVRYAWRDVHAWCDRHRHERTAGDGS